MQRHALKLGALLLLLLLIGLQLRTLPASGPITPCNPPAEKTRVIAAYGDSTTYGIGAKPAESMPVMLQSLLCDTHVLNEGVSGSTAAWLLGGDDGKHRPWPQEMAESRADIVLINYGINDTFRGTELPKDYRNTITQLVRIAKASGKQVILQTPTPVWISQVQQSPGDQPVSVGGRSYYHSPKRHAAVQQRAAIVRAVGRAEHVPVADANRVMLQLSSTHPREELFEDLHPRAIGYAAIAQEVARTVQPLKNATSKPSKAQ